MTFVRFAMVGALNTLLGISLFPILYWIAGTYLNINIILTASYLICTLFAFTMHKFVTFGSSGKSGHEGAKFVLVTAILWGINLVLLNGILFYATVNPVIVQTLIAVSLQLGNYIVLKRFVFTQTHGKDRASSVESIQ